MIFFDQHMKEHTYLQRLSMVTDLPSVSKLARLAVTTWTTCGFPRTGHQPSSVLLTSTSPSYARTSQDRKIDKDFSRT
jgi:hypothetical protein